MSFVGRHPSELAWARYLAGESRWPSRWQLGRHLASCERCRKLEAEMSAERRSFDADRQRTEDLAVLRARASASRPDPGPKPSPTWWWMIAAGVFAVMVIALAVRFPTASPGLMEKGGDVFVLHVERPSGAVVLGQTCMPGDRIMGTYRSGRSHLLLLERDGRGRIQVLVSMNGMASTKLTGSEGTTPASWILDAVPGRECFAAFFSDEPLRAAAAARAFEASRDSPVVPGATVLVHCCEKRAPR